jgi:chromosome segregation ATPase
MGPFGRKTRHLGSTTAGMSVSVDLSTPLANWEGVSSSLAEIRAGTEDCDRFFRDVFGQFDAILSDFARERERWQRERRDIEVDLARRAAELEQQRNDLQVERERIKRDGVQNDGHAEAAAAKESQLRERFEEIERERASLRETLDAAKQYVERIAEVGSQLGVARDELARARLDLEQQRSRSETSAGRPDEKTLEQLRATQTERDAAVHERMLLEAELETLRCRTAELAESLEEQKRRASDQQTQWVGELRQQRALLATLATRWTEQKLAAVQPPAATRGAQRSTSIEDGDPALESVLAQFEMLQKDVARRKAAASET